MIAKTPKEVLKKKHELMDILCSKQLITAFYQTKCKVAK